MNDFCSCLTGQGNSYVHISLQRKKKSTVPFSRKRKWNRTLNSVDSYDYQAKHKQRHENMKVHRWLEINDGPVWGELTCILGLDGNLCGVRSVRAIMSCKICVILFFLELKESYRKKKSENKTGSCLYFRILRFSDRILSIGSLMKGNYTNCLHINLEI